MFISGSVGNVRCVVPCRAADRNTAPAQVSFPEFGIIASQRPHLRVLDGEEKPGGTTINTCGDEAPSFDLGGTWFDAESANQTRWPKRRSKAPRIATASRALSTSRSGSTGLGAIKFGSGPTKRLNPNIVVDGDADKLRSDPVRARATTLRAGRVEVDVDRAIETPEIRKVIIEIMEGGKEVFDLRNWKYNFETIAD
jgi:hypothetical protein